MKTLAIGTVILATAALKCFADPPPAELVGKLTAVVREHCPDAQIALTNGLFTAKSGTMIFKLHPRQMTGEILTNTFQEEGPNYKGFVLTVGVENGAYQGQAVVPQELHGPYYPTFLAAPPTEDGTNHYWITFSYGSRLDPKLKQAVLDVLPKGIFWPDGTAITAISNALPKEVFLTNGTAIRSQTNQEPSSRP
jgi:hypothetical protein